MSERIEEGISQPQIQELVHYSNSDPRVANFTSDPSRFANLEAFSHWQEKGKSIFVLTNDEEKLLGIVWFGEKEPEADGLEKYGITFAIRLYQEARGKGLAAGFMKEAFVKFYQTNLYKNADKKGIWLEVSEDNVPAVKSYEKFGFRKLRGPNDKGKIIMAFPLIPKIPVPDNLIPESKNIIQTVLDEQDKNPNYANTDYGHIALNLALGLGAGAETFNEERQRKHLRDCALDALKEFGPEITEGFLRAELMAVLTPEDIAQFVSKK